jgi:hypothetical protein
VEFQKKVPVHVNWFVWLKTEEVLHTNCPKACCVHLSALGSWQPIFRGLFYGKTIQRTSVRVRDSACHQQDLTIMRTGR